MEQSDAVCEYVTPFTTEFQELEFKIALHYRIEHNYFRSKYHQTIKELNI